MKQYTAFKQGLDSIFVEQSALAQQACYAIGIILSKAISLFLLPFVAGQLGLIEFARLETIIALLNGAAIVVSFGMVNLLYRQAGEAKDRSAKKRIVASLFGTTLCIAALIGGGVFLSFSISLPLINQITPLSASELILCTLIMSLEGIIGLCLAWLRMEEKAFIFLRSMLMRTLVYSLLTVIGLSLGYGLTFLLFASLAASLIQASELIVHQLKSSGVRFDAKALWHTLQYGWPFVLSGFAMYASQGMEVVILAQYTSPELLAAYAIAIKFFLIAALCNQPYLLWWYARRMNVLSNPHALRSAGTGATLGVLIAMASSLLVWLWSEWLILHLFDPAILQAMNFLPWLLAAGVLKQWGALYNLGCFSSENSRIQMYIELGTGAFCVICFPVLISSYGVHGALLTFVISQLGRLVAYWFVSQHVLYIAYPLGLLVKGALGLTSILLITLMTSTTLNTVITNTKFTFWIMFSVALCASIACLVWVVKLGRPYAKTL
ncbi:lipopolysaccharide biosynthesis protein [Marinomonas balearica]|uniref:O-antigen/teichoic acid export membrane protein n=1 Tax=Marinomonas balearica TaxID=491947 RepID=A0A4R6MHC2_9GAMM|nr:oligosaccharide flippase family protein [Marinomonas balearica]TDP01065.1 O-antigen/teichoic acid export membrane protein [Marinomonas balearica]